MSSISDSCSLPFTSTANGASLAPAGSITNSCTACPALPTAKTYGWPTWKVVRCGRTEKSPSITPTQTGSVVGVAMDEAAGEAGGEAVGVARGEGQWASAPGVASSAAAGDAEPSAPT